MYHFQTTDIGLLILYVFLGVVFSSQIFVPCFCAAIIQDRFSRIGDALYCSNWFDAAACKAKQKPVNVILFQGQFMQYFQFTTWGNVFEISLPTFVSVSN